MRIARMMSAVIPGGAALVLMTGGFGTLPGIHGDRPMEQAAMRSAVEIRSYNLKPGTRAEFHRLVEATLPMLQRWKVDVVAYGPSPHDETSYYLIRAYPSLEARQRSEDAFYGSTEWREGPRERVLALIESYTTIVLDLDTATIDALRGR